MNLDNKKIWLAGHKGMLGTFLAKKLIAKNTNLLTCSRQEVDLLDQKQVEQWIYNNKPEIVIISAAKVGGIYANSNYPSEFIYENTMIQSNIIHNSYKNGVKNLIMLGASCAYPKNINEAISEEMLGIGLPETTNQWYSYAKLNGIKMCQAYSEQYKLNYFSIIPTNLYGPGDNFNSKLSHVIPSLISRFHKAKTQNQDKILIWGTGNPIREFMYVEDAADGIIYLIENLTKHNLLNLGTSEEITIRNLAHKIALIVGFKGKIEFDKSKADGVHKKLLDISKLKKFNWKHQTNLDEGLKKTYDWFLKNVI